MCDRHEVMKYLSDLQDELLSFSPKRHTGALRRTLTTTLETILNVPPVHLKMGVNRLQQNENLRILDSGYIPRYQL